MTNASVSMRWNDNNPTYRKEVSSQVVGYHLFPFPSSPLSTEHQPPTMFSNQS